ncbi:hypothetical protein AB1E19_020482 [Capra hircus]
MDSLDFNFFTLPTKKHSDPDKVEGPRFRSGLCWSSDPRAAGRGHPESRPRADSGPQPLSAPGRSSPEAPGRGRAPALSRRGPRLETPGGCCSWTDPHLRPHLLLHFPAAASLRLRKWPGETRFTSYILHKNSDEGNNFGMIERYDFVRLLISLCAVQDSGDMWADSCMDTGAAVRSFLSSLSCEEVTSTRLKPTIDSNQLVPCPPRHAKFSTKETFDCNRLFRIPDEPPSRAVDSGSESHLCHVAECEVTHVVKGHL